MRKFALVFLIASLVPPASAAKHVTVDQLEQSVAAVHSRPDADAARQLADLELTERLSSAALAHLQVELPGEGSRQALIALADASAFLCPPAAEIPTRPAPEVAEQRSMLALTVAYVSKTIPQLPNFFATRSTARFEDTPQLQKDEFFIPYQPLHRVGASSVTVLYRDGQEAIDTGSSKKPPPMTEGLITRGVFGPILGTVLIDAAQSKLAWARWERGGSGPQAVFSYVVPKEKSHYEVAYCCVASEAATAVANMHPFRRIVGYHGEMTIDPATGTILRILVNADLKAGDPVTRAAILVEYGPVEIGGKTYFCPLKSISTATGQTVQHDPNYNFPLANQLQPLKNSLNDTAFSHYHVFRAEARVLASDVADSAPPQPLAVSTASTGASVSSAPPSEPNAPATASTPRASAGSSADTSSASPPTPAAEAVPAPEPAISEITVGEASSIPDASGASHSAGPDNGFTLHTTARLVDIGVVAFDKKGHPVTDLKPEDFELDDSGRKQEIRFFSQASQTPPQPSAPRREAAKQDASVYTNRAPEGPSGQHATTESRATVLLIDASNIAWGDLSYARQEMLRFLKNAPDGEPVALYIMKSYAFTPLLEPTPDHAVVIDKLNHWMPTAQDMSNAQDEEQRNRQHIDWVAHGTDLLYVNGNDGTDPEGNVSGQQRVSTELHGLDPQLRSMGSNPQRDVLYRLEAIAHHLGLYPGHKSLVWISSDNVLADWSSQAATRQDQGPNPVDPQALRAREALNESHVSIYPLDVSQLEAAGISADLQNRLVQVKIPSPADPPPPPPNSTGRYAGEMHQDTHGIQGTFRDLAEATGGRALRRAGDIAAELNGIVNDGRAAYLISFRPDQPADNKYHQLTLRLANRRDITLRYRTGFGSSSDRQRRAGRPLDRPMGGTWKVPATTGAFERPAWRRPERYRPQLSLRPIRQRSAEGMNRDCGAIHRRPIGPRSGLKARVGPHSWGPIAFGTSRSVRLGVAHPTEERLEASLSSKMR